jgi:hypothetical protein
MSTIFVISLHGLRKRICKHDCAKLTCSRAHPNSAGSTVRHPKWCLRGWIATCNDRSCAFNHFRDEETFVNYRIKDAAWVRNNPLLAAKYTPVPDDYMTEEEEVVVEPVNVKIFYPDGERSYASVCVLAEEAASA